MDMEKVFVNEDLTGVLICPQCKKRKIANFSPFMGGKSRTAKVKCTCESHFRILIDFRRSYRKNTDLDGAFTKIAYKKAKGEMRVLNLSMHGLGFKTITPHYLSQGDRVSMRFTLDDQKQSEIEKDGVVRHVDGTYVGCEFTDPSQHERTLGFYLMP